MSCSFFGSPRKNPFDFELGLSEIALYHAQQDRDLSDIAFYQKQVEYFRDRHRIWEMLADLCESKNKEARP